jgi:hypothetical protein
MKLFQAISGSRVVWTESTQFVFHWDLEMLLESGMSIRITC